MKPATLATLWVSISAAVIMLPLFVSLYQQAEKTHGAMASIAERISR